MWFPAVVMGEDGSEQKLRLEYWMNDLPAQIKDIPLIYLAIPGNINILIIEET